MTKEELDRIKEAYYSGLKVQIWFDGHWEDFDVREYSMYPDPFSENRMYRIVGSEYADMAEKRIKDLEGQVTRAFEVLEDKRKRIADLEHQLQHRNCLDCSNHSSKLRMRTLELEKENAELKKSCQIQVDSAFQMIYEKDDQLTKAKEIIKNLMVFAEMDDREYEEEYKEAEQFLSEVEK